MTFIRKHWFLLGCIALFFYAVYSGSKKLGAIASVLFSVATWFIPGWGLFKWLLIASGLYMTNWLYGFIPGADGWYDWIPRKGGGSNFQISN